MSTYFNSRCRHLILGICLALLGIQTPTASSDEPTSDVAPWIADRGDGTFQNPVLFADYSDPDVVRVDDEFYMTSSSFNCVPALPILRSTDLVNWTLIGHAVERLPSRFDSVQHGNGIWAPSLRFYDGYFWIFVGDPDWGILMTRARDPAGPWEPLHVVKEGAGFIDPCPLWDGDKAYLVHAYAKSRAGKNSILDCWEMSRDGRRLLDGPHLVIDGRNDVHPTIEGPKFYKRNGWYYIFAPAGGVKTGWQLAARAKNPLGPYEVRRVLEQGSTDINGPHQGGWVELENGENWFLHFQDRGAYGRVVHLNPVRWVNDWPEMGVDLDGNGVGEPVSTYRKPNVNVESSLTSPATSDEFDGRLGLQWQWQGNPHPDWYTLSARPGWLRLRAMPAPAGDLTAAPHQLLQKLPAPAFTATTRLDQLSGSGVQAGLVVMGQTYAGLFAEDRDGKIYIQQISNDNPRAGESQRVHASASGLQNPVWLHITVAAGGECHFHYSVDGERFVSLGEQFTATPGRWIGAKVGLVCLGEGHAEFDWFRIQR